MIKYEENFTNRNDLVIIAKFLCSNDISKIGKSGLFSKNRDACRRMERR